VALRLPTLETSFENGRAGMIRATGAVLIASALLYFSRGLLWRSFIEYPKNKGHCERNAAARSNDIDD